MHRKLEFADFLLTETTYDPVTSAALHAHELGSFGFALRGSYAELSHRANLICDPRVVLFRPPSLPHEHMIGEEGATVLWIETSRDWLQRVSEYCGTLSSPAVLDSANVRQLGRRLRQRWADPPRSALLAIEGLLYEVAAELCDDPCRRRNGPPKWLDEVAELLRRQFWDPPHITEIGHQFGYHPVHVARTFRDFYGKTIAEYIRELRIHFARERLELTEDRLVDIALAAGFASQAHFCTAFRKETGSTPAEYRRSVRRHDTV